MLKSAFCIVLALAITNVCYGHGDELCARGSKGFITHFVPGEERISDRVKSTATYPGGHGHHKAYPGGTESWGYWSELGYAYVLEQYANGSWDVLDDFDDCKPEADYVPPTPAPTPAPYVPPTPTPDVPAETIPDEVIPTPVVSIPDVMVTYSMTFPKGISALHLPIKPKVIYFTDLFEALSDDNVNWIFALRPTVQHWTHVTSVNSRQNEWISEYRGFVTYMENETTIELAAIERQYGYSMMYLRDGMNLIGVPRQAEALETVGDFYQRFPGILSVKSIPANIEYDMPTEIDLEWFVDLDDDVAVSPTAGYMIEHNGNDEYPLWGTQWTYEPPSAAPGVDQWQKMATTTRK